ncbi:MAG: putative bifunctional diguanylate cyclase/phosphodiesterase [Phormidesmis sp.]
MQKVLVIARPSSDRTDLVRHLESEDFAVLTADDGSAGISSSREHRPSLILCDWALSAAGGELNGYQVLEAIRQDSDLMLTPFVLLTEVTARSHHRQAMAIGADDCLVQPFTYAEISSTIAARLNRQTAINERYATALRKSAEQINRLGHYDSLTDLPNHHLLHQRLQSAIAAAYSNQTSLALMTISLDRLRLVNTVLSYSNGDHLLKATAHRLKACLPANAILARLTANQFAVVLPNLEEPQQATKTAENFIDALGRPFSLTNQEVFVTTSIGIALLPRQGQGQGQDVFTLLRQADAALEAAKKQKGNCCQIYRADMPVALSNQIMVETWLRHALERNEFELYYQPQLNLSTGQIEGCEALIRWRHPEQGYISPTQFIPLAEATGLIVDIGRWVLQTACAQARRWQIQNLGMRYVSVNLSGVQVNQPDLIEAIHNILETSGLSPDQLELEVTETALMQDAESAITTLLALKALGIRIAIDDFGTGYSSLSYLKQLPVDTLKIDRCFVRGAHYDPKNQAILKSTIEMAHRLDLKVVAEGVEEQTEQTLLTQYQCDYLQGHRIGRPMPVAAFESYLETTRQRSLRSNPQTLDARI